MPNNYHFNFNFGAGDPVPEQFAPQEPADVTPPEEPEDDRKPSIIAIESFKEHTVQGNIKGDVNRVQLCLGEDDDPTYVVTFGTFPLERFGKERHVQAACVSYACMQAAHAVTHHPGEWNICETVYFFDHKSGDFSYCIVYDCIDPLDDVELPEITEEMIENWAAESEDTDEWDDESTEVGFIPDDELISEEEEILDDSDDDFAGDFE